MSDENMQGDDLTPKQRVAIRALLDGAKHQDAARAAGVRPEQVSRWLRLPTFRAALREGDQELLEGHARRWASLGEKALGALETILDSPTATDGVKMRAVEVWARIRLANHQDIDLEQRVAELENLARGE